MAGVDCVPYGWSTKGVARHKREDWEGRNWPQQVVSFEAWCASTLYEPAQANGGVKFQQLMRYILGQMSGDEKSDFIGKLGIRPYYTGKEKGTVQDMYASATSRTPATPPLGAHLGPNSDWPLPPKRSPLEKDFSDAYDVVAPMSRKPATKVQWWKSTGMDMSLDGVGACGSGGAGGNHQRQWIKEDDGLEKEGCVRFGHRMAAYYGLYYYEGCTDNEANWAVPRVAGGYTVRMRLPNPNYEWQSDNLWIKEKMPDGRLIGKPGEGFPLSKVLIDKNNMPLFADDDVCSILVSETREDDLVDVRSLPAAVIFPSIRGTNTHHSAVSKRTRERCEEAYKVFGDIVHLKDDHFYGFKSPLALWLYPHFTLPNSAITGLELVEQTRPGVYAAYEGDAEHKFPAGKYQPYRGLLPYEDVRKLDSLKKNSLQRILEPPVVYDSLERYKYVLGRPARQMTGDFAEVKRQMQEAAAAKMQSDVMLVNMVDRQKQRTGTIVKRPQPAAAASSGLPPLQATGTPRLRVTGGDDEEEEEVELQEQEAFEQEGVEDPEGEDVEMQEEQVADDQEQGASVQADDHFTNVMSDIDLQRGEQDPLAEGGAFIGETLDGREIEEADLALDNMPWTDLKERKKAVTEKFGGKRERMRVGERRRAIDGNLNAHWKSSEFQPWPYQDVFHLPQVKYIEKVLNEEEAAEAVRKYGNSANLYLRSATNPVSITGVQDPTKQQPPQPVPGTTKEEYYRSIQPRDASDIQGLKHMRAILAIFFDRDGRMRNNIDKRNGMLYGVWIPKGNRIGVDPCQTMKNVVTFARNPTRGEKNDYACVIRPVFTVKKPEDVEDLDSLKSYYKDATFASGGPEYKASWHTHDSSAALNADILAKVKSDMTVRQWLESPWSYEYLPYYPQPSMFRDGETFSKGCRRCGRLFYEYEHFHEAYWFTERRKRETGQIPWSTMHWPQMYWMPNSVPTAPQRVSSCDVAAWTSAKMRDFEHAYAPQPFHEPAFHGASVRAWNKKGEEIPKAVDQDTAGYHGWETKPFLIRELRCEMGRRRNKNKKGALGRIMEQLEKTERPFTYRETNNMYYDSSDTYHGITQGRLTGGNAKVRFGMFGYKLMRANKYTNTCKDCAAVLTMAPGLYLRNSSVSDAQEDKKKREVWHKADWIDELYYEDVRNRIPRMYNLDFGTAGRQTGHFDPDFIRLQRGELQEKKRDANNKKWSPENFIKLHDWHMKVFAKASIKRTCPHMVDENGALRPHVDVTAIREPRVHVQTAFRVNARDPKLGRTARMRQESEAMDTATRAQYSAAGVWLTKATEWMTAVFNELRSEKITVDKLETELALDPNHRLFPKWIIQKEHLQVMGTRALYDVLNQHMHDVIHQAEVVPTPTRVGKFDPDMQRLEWRDVTVRMGGTDYEHTLVTRTWQPDNFEKEISIVRDPRQGGSLMYKWVYYLKGGGMYVNPKMQLEPDPNRAGLFATIHSDARAQSTKHGWQGDEWLMEVASSTSERPKFAIIEQTREMKQSRLFITYSLHRGVTTEYEARLVMERMADGVRYLFGRDDHLCDMLLFGKKLELREEGTDTISERDYVTIFKARKKEKTFYGDADEKKSSYTSDTFTTHVDGVDIDCGVEIGPTLHHPHFHLLLTINHWGYVQIDYYRMKQKLEHLYKGIPFSSANPNENGSFKLLDASGLPFYGDNENPYVDIKLYPTDNWQQVIAAYVRKTAQPDIFESIRNRMSFPTRAAGSAAPAAAGAVPPPTPG